MRTGATEIWNAWSTGGPFVGDYAPHGVVTVETNWYLNKSTGANIGANIRGPVRWWQRADNSQEEIVVPNVASINWDRSLDQDAATCTITLNNQWHHVNGSMALNDSELGKPGYFTFNRGESAESQARWNHETNDWNQILVPNALLRTYEGYGGRNKTLGEALDDGNLLLTGVWLIDDIRINTGGRIELQCRDMAKLLIEQLIYPPLVPSSLYPLQYCRWAFRDIRGSRVDIVVPEFLHVAINPLVEGADTDYAGDVPQPDVPDYVGNEPGNGYWVLLSNGEVVNFGNNPHFGNASANYITFYARDLKVTPTGDGYYILRTDGLIQVFGDAVSYGYTLRTASSDNFFSWVAQSPSRMAVRPDGTGYWVLHMGGNVNAYGSAVDYGSHVNTNIIYPNWLLSTFATDISPTTTGLGYWTLDQRGKVEAHGDAIHHGEPGGVFVDDWWRIVRHPLNDDGYWVMSGEGIVLAYGSCVGYGDVSDHVFEPGDRQPVTDYAVSSLVPTPTGEGYWIFGVAGGVFPFGDAMDYGALDRDFTTHLREDGNYKDYSDIVTDLLLWSGWWLYGSLQTSWIDYDYDDSNWTTPAELITVGGAKTSWPVPWTSSFPDDSAQVIWATGTSINDAPNGTCFFRKQFFIATEGSYTLSVLADNLADVYLDGELVLTPGQSGTGLYYTEGFTILSETTIDLTVGNHILAFRVQNVTAPLIQNPGGLGWSLAEEGGPVVLRSDNTSVMLEYPAATPSSSDRPEIYGNIESTGAFASDCISNDVFDKRPVIDAINTLKEIVGYIFWIDEEGAARFESPNIWSEGNFDENGLHSILIPDLDERLHITNYGVSLNDKSLRSEIVISSSDPTATLNDTVTTRYFPPNIDNLRGIEKPAVWVNEVFTSKREQEIMAELIALFGWLSQRLGSVTVPANPAIQVNDQIRIWERQTSETYIHYVRGITSKMDLETGLYEMTFTTNWMGDGSTWAIDIGGNGTDFNDLANFSKAVLTYRIASGDLGFNSAVHGHYPTQSLDGVRSTFWLSAGNATNDPTDSMEYIEYDLAQFIDLIGLHPWGGNYTAYVSIMEGGFWVGSNVIPYTGLTYANSDQYDARIPYVTSVGLGWDNPQVIELPRRYIAQRIRITLANLQYTQWGADFYRGGLREVIAAMKVS